MAITVELPIKFIRQQAEPLDVDSVFASTAARNSYLTNARRYGGQIVSDLEDGKAYKLNASRTAWVEIGTGGGSDIMIKDTVTMTAGPGTYVLLDADGYFIDKIIINDTAADTISIGTALAGQDVMFPKTYIIGKWDGVTTDVFSNGADLTLYFTGITGTATVTIYKRKL